MMLGSQCHPDGLLLVRANGYVEEYPISAIEAIAVGVLVIPSNIAGAVEHRVTGLLRRPPNNETLKKANVTGQRLLPERREIESRRQIRRRNQKAPYMLAAVLGR